VRLRNSREVFSVLIGIGIVGVRVGEFGLRGNVGIGDLKLDFLFADRVDYKHGL